MALSFASRAVYVYRGGMPEPDSVMIAAGVALGATGDCPFSETFLYGRQLNPGVYLIMRATFPYLWNDPTSAIPILNWSSAILGTLTLLPLYGLLRTRLAPRVALACAGIWAFTPLVWEGQTYFHPLVPATLLLLLSLTCARRIDRSPRGWWFFIATSVLAVAAFVIRADVAFALPGIAALVVGSRNRSRNVLMLFAVCSAVGITYAVILAATAGANAEAGMSLQRFVSRYHEMYGMSFSLHGLPRSLAWMIMALGVASLGACGIGLVYRRRTGPPGERSLLDVAGGLLWALPSIVFWLPYMVPILRHYYIASLGVIWLVGVVFLEYVRPARVVPIAVAVIAINLCVPEVLYRTYNALATSPPKTPHGTFFYFHKGAAEDVERLVELRRAVYGCSRSEDVRNGPRAIVLCRWNVFVNVVYEVASEGHAVVPAEKRVLVPETRYVRYQTSDGEIRLIHYLYLENPAVWERVSGLLSTAWEDGYCVFVPETIRDRLADLGPGTPGVIGYR